MDFNAVVILNIFEWQKGLKCFPDCVLPDSLLVPACVYEGICILLKHMLGNIK